MVAIVSICHKGDLEIKTAFLIYTLRKYLKGDYNLYVGIPNENSFIQTPSNFFFDFCVANQVEIFFFDNEYLNTIETLKEGDLISNKVYLWSKDFTEDYIIFMDSDTMILRPFNVNELISETPELKIKPVDKSNVSQWEKLYEMVGISYPEKEIISSVDQIKMPPYFNSGIIVFNRSTLPKIVKLWEEYFLLISDKFFMKKIQFPIFHRNQIALVFAMMKNDINFSLLNESFNYPAHIKRINIMKMPYVVHYHWPTVIYFEPLLHIRFKDFLLNNACFLEIVNGTWKKIFSRGMSYKFFIVIIEIRKKLLVWYNFFKKNKTIFRIYCL